MTIDKRETVTLPKWVLIIVLPFFMSVVGTWGTYLITNTKAKAIIETKVGNQKESIDELKRNKVGIGEFDFIKAQLNRIEKKLDDHIDK